MWTRHHLLLGILLLGNALLFAGVDAIVRLVTAVVVLVLMFDIRQIPELPRVSRWCGWGFGTLVLLQLVPLPMGLRGLLQPGLVDFAPPGWAPLSVAPWATLEVAASVVVMAGIVLVAARMASTRTGLPALLSTLALCCGLLGVLGLAGEASAPDKVLLVRANTGGGDVYGPFVNSNHFAAAIELSLPAAMVLLAVGLRHILERRSTRQRSMVVSLAAAVSCAIGCAAMLRSGSRGGMLFLVLAAIATLPLWWRSRGARRWRWIPVVMLIVVVALGLASTRLDAVREEFSNLLVLEGVGGNSRWDLWQGTMRLWQRAPLLGCGLGGYRYAIGLDKPATEDMVLEQAHNDWLEWLATGGVAGAALLATAVFALLLLLLPGSIRRLRFEYRYPLAGAGMALVATALHETVGFALQTPLNRYLLASWVGLVWGLRVVRTARNREDLNDDG